MYKIRNHLNGAVGIYGYTGTLIAEVEEEGKIRLYLTGRWNPPTHVYENHRQFRMAWPGGFGIVSCFMSMREV